MRIVIGFLSPTQTDNLFILASIQPTELRRQKAVLFLARRSQKPENILYERLLSPLRRQLRQLKSRHPFVPAALELHWHKWGMAATSACKCGAKEQTAEQVITCCPIYHHPNGARALSDVHKSLVTWLKETCKAI